ITGQKRAEAEKKALQDQLFQARKADSLGRMAGAVAHHYNNLLSVVIGNLELADMDEPQNSGRLKLIRAAMNAARRAADISTQMLTYLGQGIGKHVPIPLSVICHRKLAQITDAMPDTITLHTHLPDPGPLVQADADQIAQVLSNLVMNASEAIGGKVGEIRVSIGILTAAQAWVLNPYPVDWEPKSAEYACLSIQDTGEGMNPETVEKIFDPFFSTRFIGRGLGLSVVLGIVKAHDGAVSVETLSGSGSIFRIFLPVADENPPTETGDPAKPDVLIGVC
ncbi:MAG: sensor histidine kinase, partial [Desulfatirhabdiaceae bacterium]